MPIAFVLFTVRYEKTKWGEGVYLTGSSKELGGWNVDHAIALQCKGGLWYAVVAIELQKEFEYKYFFRGSGSLRWEVNSHKRSFDLVPGLFVEVRDLWYDTTSFLHDIASSSFVKDVCMHRQDPKKLPQISVPADDGVSVVFEIPVPLISPMESMRLIGESRKTKFWPISKSEELYDSTCPVFQGLRTFSVTEFPIQYKYVMSHNLGWECENIEIGSNHVCFPPIPIDTSSPSSVLWLLQDGHPAAVPFSEAVKSGLCTPPPLGHSSAIFIESPSFRYPNPPEFKAAGLVIPIFSLRTKQSLGIGEFKDLVMMAEFCQKAGLRLIQTLPITDTTVNGISWMDSYPYSSTSSFALHPIYVNIDSITPLPKPLLAELPKKKEELNQKFLDYEATLTLKLRYLREIFDFHGKEGLVKENAEFERFRKDAAYWLPSYAAFKVLAAKNGTTEWMKWGEEEKKSENVAVLVEEMQKTTHPAYKEVLFQMWIQFHLDKQLREASVECKERFHVGLKGDIPIGVDPRSADAWFFRRYFRLDTQAGAPPDDFSAHGQNWGFPTYNWEEIQKDGFEWWAWRLRVMGRYMHAYRIDHILGFFRIWEIPTSARSGVHARFYPGRLVDGPELNRRGLTNDHERLTTPIITKGQVTFVFGEEEGEEITKKYLEKAPSGSFTEYVVKREYRNEAELSEAVKRDKGITAKSTSADLKAIDGYLKKFYVLTNSVCLYYFPGGFAPRFDVHKTESFRLLGRDWQDSLRMLSEEYFHTWHQDIFEDSAKKKFPKMREATKMLICGEDLGLLSPVIPRVMKEYNILGLRVQRMTASPAEGDYYHPKNYPIDVVATTSTHDMPPLRAWWQITNLERPDMGEVYRTENWQRQCHIRDCFWFNTLCNHTARPQVLAAEQVERIVDMHLYSPAMLAVFPYQDIVAILEDKEVYHENPWDEIINDPDIRCFYWKYRMPCHVETLLTKTPLIDRIRGKIIDSGRLKVH